MAQFGKADLGLIKATAGAEAAKHADSNLILGQSIKTGVGAIAEAYANKKAANNKKIGELDKAFNESYKMPSGALDTQMEDFLRDKMKSFKQVFLDNQDGSFEAKRALAENERNFMEVKEQMDNAQGIVNNNVTSSYVPNGMDDDDHVLASKLKNRYYLPGMRPNAVGNGNQMYYAIPINDKNPPTFSTQEQKKIDDIEAKPLMQRTTAENEALAELKTNKTKHDADLAEWNRVDKLRDEVTIDGVTTYNQNKYTLVNPNEAARYGGVDESRTNMLSYVNQETSQFTKDAHFDVMKTPSIYAKDIESRMLKGDPNTIDPQTGKKGAGKVDTRTELNDILYSDGTPKDNVMVNIAFNTDGTQNTEEPEEVENSYANMFIYELADTEKHSYMYNDENGNPIEWKIEEGEPNLVYGSDEWNGVAPLKDGSYLSKEERINLLEMKLRGKDTLGTEKGVGNFDPHQITQYAKFQGIVLSEQREAQKRKHYENSSLYFDDGVNDPYQHAKNKRLSVEQRSAAVYDQKEETYTNSIIDMAFGNDDSKTFSSNTDSKEGMEKIKQILKEEFKTVGMDVEVKSSGRSIEIEGKEFDFSDPENRVQMLKDLKLHIVNLRDEGVDDKGEIVDKGPFFKQRFLDNVENSVEDWKEDFKTKRRKHYPVSFLPDAPPFLASTANNTAGSGNQTNNTSSSTTTSGAMNTQNTQNTNTGTQPSNTGTQATTGGVSGTATTTATTPAATTWRSNEKVQAFRVDQFNVKGSSGAGAADIFKNNEAINVEVAGGMATVKGVRADGDKLVVDVEAPFNMGGEKTMGEFSKSGNSFKFNPNKEIYSQLKGEDKKDFDAFVLAIETDPAFAMEIMKSVEGETDFNPVDYK